MGILTEIRNFKYEDLSLFVCAFLGTVASGFLIIFHFRPELIEKYDIVKLIFLSLALTMPLVLINMVTVVAQGLRDPDPNLDKRRINHLGGALLFTAILIYPPLFISYLASLRFSVFVWMVLGIHILYLLSTLGSILAKKLN